MVGDVLMRTMYKPNMHNLKGKVGKSVIQQIRASKKPSLDSVKKEADECITRILANRKNGKSD